MRKYEYHVIFRSELDDAKKQQIINKLQAQLGPFVADGTIEATTTAIEIRVVDVGELHPLYQT